LVEITEVTPSAITVSTVDSTWAAVRCSRDCQDPANWLFLFHREPSGWHRTGVFEQGPRPLGFCAYAAAVIIRDLFRIACPAWRALHARHAFPVEKHELVAALSRKYGVDDAHRVIRNPCVSRIDPNWAAATISAREHWDPAQFWFHQRAGRWRVAYAPPYGARGRPSGSILLSLASCVGYSASV